MSNSPTNLPLQVLRRPLPLNWSYPREGENAEEDDDSSVVGSGGGGGNNSRGVRSRRADGRAIKQVPIKISNPNSACALMFSLEQEADREKLWGEILERSLSNHNLRDLQCEKEEEGEGGEAAAAAAVSNGRVKRPRIRNCNNNSVEGGGSLYSSASAASSSSNIRLSSACSAAVPAVTGMAKHCAKHGCGNTNNGGGNSFHSRPPSLHMPDGPPPPPSLPRLRQAPIKSSLKNGTRCHPQQMQQQCGGGGDCGGGRTVSMAPGLLPQGSEEDEEDLEEEEDLTSSL